MEETAGSPPSRWRQAALVGGAVLPLVFFAYLFLTQAPPAEAMARSLNLHGTWKVLPGDAPGGERPETDDRDAPDIRVPGGYAAQGFHAREAWLRRRFEAPAGLLDRPLFLMLSDTQSGHARIFLNGQPVGETEPFALGSKTDASGTEGWDVPAGLLRPGKNVLAVHFRWGFLGADGINNDHVLLGPTELLKRHYLELGDKRRVLQYGAAFLMVFLILLFGALLTAQWSTPNRPLYLSCIALLSATAIYLGVYSGVFIRVEAAGPFGAPSIFLSILFVIYAQPDFITQYFRGPRAPFRRLHAAVCAGFLLAFIVTLALGKEEVAKSVFTALNAYAFIPVAYATWIMLRAQLGRPLGTDLILASGVLCGMVTGAADLAHNVGLISAQGMYPLGAATGAIMAAVVLIADFTKVSFDNLALSNSLKDTNAELADALVRAQEAVRLKSEFVATVSHELRTPLNSVLNIPEGLLKTFAEQPGARCSRCHELFTLEPGDRVEPSSPCPACFERGALSPEPVFQFQGDVAGTVRGLRQVHRAGKHLLSLIDDVLDFSKLEAGRMTLALERVDVGAVLRGVQETLEPLARKKGIHLSLHCPAPAAEPALQADPVKLAQVFINLVGNAVKFSPEGSEVELRAELRGDTWTFAVRDRGIGIAPENHEAIFESFRQVDGGNTRRFGGTGLGLAITRKLVEAHGGRIHLASGLNEGSTFFVELPRTGPTRPGAAGALPAGSVATKGRTILILDDERIAVENLRLALRPLGHHIEGIQDPRTLEQALAEHQPDLLILDVMMPGLSGLDILRSLNAREAKIPVLVSSAYHANMDVVRALGASWIQKPWRSDELQAEVTRVLVAASLSSVG